VTSITLNAAGEDSTASIDDVNVFFGSVGAMSVIASGTDAFALISDAEVGLNVGSVNVVASGVDSAASITTLDVGLHVGQVNVTASGVDSYASISQFTADSVGAINLVASATDAFAHIETFSITNDVGVINFTASGTDAGVSNDAGNVSGNVGTVNVTASGTDASASLDLVVGGGVGHVGTVNVLASGIDSFASAFVSASTIDNMSVRATASDAYASLDVALSSFTAINMSAVADSSVNLSISSFQTTTGGVINASGAGFFAINVNHQGGFTVNGNGISGPQATFVFEVNDAADDTLTTTVNAINSHHSFIEAGVGLEIINVGNAIGPTTPAVFIGNTFDFEDVFVDTAWGPYGNTGTIVPTSGPTSITAPSEIISSGFTSILNGGTDFNGNAGLQLDIDAPGTATNFVANLTPAGSLTAVLNAASAAFNGTVEYYFGVVGGNGILVVDENLVAHNVTQVVQLTGVTAMTFNDLA